MDIGTLYIVPTPIGNLEDITLRALKVLKEVDYIVCEDTRQTIKLLNHYEIKKALKSFFTHNQIKRIPEITRDLKAGKILAIVSDGGTPGISDPGSLLISKAIEEKILVVSLPGPTAVTTALTASGLASDGFVFLGFLRRKAGKLKKELKSAALINKTIIFYESPYRVKKTLELCQSVFEKETKVVLARELTKSFEEYIRGTIGEVIDTIREKDLKGEFVVLISSVNKKAEKANG
ncbi:16S rRNA (cytidine(1402)-2'-O)-methyltransferase [Elusimicrobiota bacterium]